MPETPKLAPGNGKGKKRSRDSDGQLSSAKKHTTTRATSAMRDRLLKVPKEYLHSQYEYDQAEEREAENEYKAAKAALKEAEERRLLAQAELKKSSAMYTARQALDMLADSKSKLDKARQNVAESDEKANQALGRMPDHDLKALFEGMPSSEDQFGVKQGEDTVHNGQEHEQDHRQNYEQMSGQEGEEGEGEPDLYSADA